MKLQNLSQKKIILLILLSVLFFVIISISSNVEAGTSFVLKNPLKVNDPNVIVGNLIKGVMGFAGTIALVMFIYGGLMWMFSGGKTDLVEKGKKTFIWATLGLLVIFSSYIVVFKIFDFISKMK